MNIEPAFDDELNMRLQHLMEIILAERFNDLDKDYDACVELLAISEREDYAYGIAFAYAYLGDCLIGKNESVSASTHLLKAKELCESYRFLDLLPNVCNWLGIYYEMQNDRQMAMHYYLNALDFAEKKHDLLRKSILLNNIASQFQSCGNYEKSKEYYLKAYECFHQLEHPNVEDPHYAQMTANIISACCRLKQIDEAKHYYDLLEQSGQLGRNQNQLYLCELLISASLGDAKATQQIAHKYIKEMQLKPQDLHQFFETLLIVAESMIALDEPVYAREMLNTLNDLCREEEYGHRLKVQYVWMRFFRLFGTEEEKNDAYREFYELRQMSDNILNCNLADGLLSKIKLRDSVHKNEEIEHARKLLEGELQYDELTQLYSRRSFRKLTEQAISDPRVHTLSFIMIDVDYFKQYNDTYGHAKGDDTLRAVADSMNSISDSSICNFRYGGDEFVSMCKNMTTKEVERYIKAFSETLQSRQIPHKSSLCSDQVTLSIGFSFHTKPDLEDFDLAKILAEADTALYHSKEKGRNCYSSYSGQTGST